MTCLTFRFSPAVVKQLPDRLRGLAGKKIVIDGTLITQRLHFAQVPHPYRHVLGWYRLVKELQDSGVSAICVFDGKERSLAKAREAERRREAQKLAVARGSIELDRVKRLNRLIAVIDRFEKLDVLQKARVSELLQRISSESSFTTPGSEPESQDNIPDFASEVVPVLDQPQEVRFPSAPPSSPPTPETSLLPSTPFGARPEPSSASSTANQTLPPLDRPFPSTFVPEDRDTGDSKISLSLADATLGTLGMLYFGFRNSVRKLASLTPAPPDASTSAEEARVEYSMTKSQIQLMADEEKFWEDLVSPDSDLSDPQSAKEALTTLSYRADVMSQSYQRRTNPPTTQTYDESKELLRTMGVPCIDTTGTYEAEALASSLVINGLADFVASEDTDVIVYEAPLIRNITNRNGPLMLLSGEEIRTALQLDRASFIDFALLLGTDFSQRIKNVGPTRALKFIRQHKSIERVIEVETKFTPRVPAPTYLAEVEVARLVFQTLPPVPDAKLMEQDKDDEGLTVLLQRFGLGKLLMSDEDSWEFGEALQGNYFSDDPSAY
ncbi:PIN domain-like protein [Mycena galericulata]|nr:PIN domain-like protein [Mycena galericulata]